MAKIDITNANGSGPGTIDCKWHDCKKHQSPVIYPGKGVLKRGSLSSWPHPSEKPGLPAQTTKITDEDFFRQKDGTKKRENVSANNYKYQRHHVIPVQVFNSLSDLKKDLEFLGYNINIHAENGICLPFRIKDLVWHDLQYHRGSHPIYTAKVKKRVEDIMSVCESLCEDGRQAELWDYISSEVELCIEEIINWELLIHPAAGVERDNAILAWI